MSRGGKVIRERVIIGKQQAEILMELNDLGAHTGTKVTIGVERSRGVYDGKEYDEIIPFFIVTNKDGEDTIAYDKEQALINIISVGK